MASLRKVAWARGFFRIWVFATILWVAFVAALTMEDYPNEYSYAARTMIYADTPTGLALTSAYGSTSWTISGYGDMVTLAMLQDALNASKEANRPSDVEQLSLAVNQAKDALEAAKSFALKRAAIACVSIPAVLLLLGAIVAWVLRGFRSPA